jgi:hypothetical protein
MTFPRILLLAALLPACSRTPEQPFQIQGTVTSIGYARPVPDAEVLVKWPAALGGGELTLRTDREGRYAVSRRVRPDRLDCTGLTITVRAGGFASAYSSRDSTAAACGDSVLTVDFRLFPIQ